MRTQLFTLFLLGLVVASAPAFAQTTTSTATVAFSTTVNTTRQGSERAADQSGGVILISAPIGPRDCGCETWTFTGNFGPADTGTVAPQVQWWVGTTSSQCATATNRLQGGTGVASATCWQINTTVVPSQPYIANGSFTVTIPSVLLVNPFNNTCAVPPPGQMATGTLNLYALVVDGSDPAPSAMQSYAFDLSQPTAPIAPTASPDDTAAHISWTSGTTVDEGGVSIADMSQVAFYVLCVPQATVAVTDAATPCSPIPIPPGVGYDASTDADAAADAGVDIPIVVPDAGFDTGVLETGADATDESALGDVVDAGTDGMAAEAGDAAADALTVETGAPTDAATDVAAVPDGAVVCPAGLPSTFDPNDSTQFSQYVCSSMLGASASSVEVSGLVNGQGYNFYVVSQNAAGTRSAPVLATPTAGTTGAACVVPVPLTDFWHHYVESGGRAQPGFCDIRPGPVSLRGTLGGVGLGFAGVGLLRWRRRRSRRGQDGK